MSKLSKSDQFLDLSDYGRPIAKKVAFALKNTRVTPIHITLAFGICGLFAVYFILNYQFKLAAIFLILKSIIDAIDGELARVKKTPSYTGRYLDSVFDILLNALIFAVIGWVSNNNLWLVALAFFSLQLQGTLYNFYYVILRNQSLGGDTTSKIFENKRPEALPGESQQSVNILFTCYILLYGLFDKIIQNLDKTAFKSSNFPSWFMSCLSLYGLGFQLLIIALMLSLSLTHYIIPFFIFYNVFLALLILIRKTRLN
jgi:phosphatidylglycerophosphate synthase